MRLVFFSIFSLAGLGVLLSLGTWQVQRLNWKQSVIAEIQAGVAAAPVALPDQPTAERDKYLPVTATGTIQPHGLRVLTSQKGIGAGYRIISPFLTEGRLVLLDRGFVPVNRAVPGGHAEPVRVVGNLHWPDETDSFTPAPEVDTNIWFARDVPYMASSLGTEPVMIVLREASFDDTPVTPLPVDTVSIPNDHLQYAITWFSLALIWAVMATIFLWRNRAKPES